MKSISFIIPNYNGKRLLEKNLPYLLNSFTPYTLHFTPEIIVVDDASTDGSVEFLKQNFPQVKVIVNEENRGFAYTCNRGVKEAKGDIVYLLNSDCRVKDGFLEYILPYFRNNKVFAVGSVEENNFTFPEVKFKYGILYYKYKEIQSTDAFEVFFTSGGHSAFDRKKFLDLDGFDENLKPFYGEDIDLCWRARKKGWKIILEPRSQAFHEGQKTIGKYNSKSKLRIVLWKNRFFLMWKNFSKKEFLYHILNLPFLIFISPFRDVYFFFGFLKASFEKLL